MNDVNSTDRILAALRKMTLWIQFWVLLNLFMGFIFGCIASCEIVHRRVQEAKSFEGQLTWNAVWQDSDQGRRDQAIEKAKKILKAQPYTPGAHERMGDLYLVNNILPLAEMEYERAYELWPSEDNEKTLATIRKRIEAQKAKTPTAPAHSLGPVSPALLEKQDSGKVTAAHLSNQSFQVDLGLAEPTNRAPKKGPERDR